MKDMFRIVEVSFDVNRRNFTREAGVWQPTIEHARALAAQLAPLTLAHRMWIAQGSKGGDTVVEEIDLAPLVERFTEVHRRTLKRVDPARLEHEERVLTRLPSWRQRLPLLPELRGEAGERLLAQPVAEAAEVAEVAQ